MTLITSERCCERRGRVHRCPCDKCVPAQVGYYMGQPVSRVELRLDFLSFC